MGARFGGDECHGAELTRRGRVKKDGIPCSCKGVGIQLPRPFRISPPLFHSPLPAWFQKGNLINSGVCSGREKKSGQNPPILQGLENADPTF